MDEPDRSQNDWIRQWIEQQRLLLQQRNALHQEGTASPDLKQRVLDLGNKWLDLGQAYLSGLEQFANSAQPGAASSMGFKLGADFIGAWQTQWQSSTPTPAATDDGAALWSDVLRQLPPIGLAREHNVTLRELASAHAECQRLGQALRSMLFGVQTEALNVLERRVREREATQAVTGFRELYDLWVECGEQVFAQVAHSDAYCVLQAQLGNATVQMRARQQKLVEHALKQFDLPTRSELNSVHRLLREQAQQLRELKEQLDGLQQPLAGERSATRSRPQRSKGKSS